MIDVLTNEQMRQSDAYTINQLGVESRVLMERAGSAIADQVVKYLNGQNDKSILVVCGVGNNGGDGYVCARVLLSLGYNVMVYALEGKFSTDCSEQKQRYTGQYSDKICGDIIVDCVFGTGLSRQVTGIFEQTINQINESHAYVISADIPSGLNGDNGLIMGTAVKADLTVAIAHRKFGMFLGEGLDCCGQIVCVDIGIDAVQVGARIYERKDIVQFYPKRKRNTHKGTYGSANIVAGSDKYRGVAALACQGAMRSGCGYVMLSTCNKVIDSLVAKFPQVIYLNEANLKANAIAVGMGCGVSAELYENISYILKNYTGKLIIDADGLNSIAKYGVNILNDKCCEVLVTPHVKEFCRLTGLESWQLLSSPVEYAQKFAAEHKITVLLKGACTVITDGNKTCLNISGSTALSKGGSGDMLSGLICGNAARGLNLFDSAVASTYILGKSAEIAGEQYTDYCATSAEIIKNMPKAIKDLWTK
jgi:NAD(P)H-hydrate epimerase